MSRRQLDSIGSDHCAPRRPNAGFPCQSVWGVVIPLSDHTRVYLIDLNYWKVSAYAILETYFLPRPCSINDLYVYLEFERCEKT
jgi:hypothetical protein